MLPQDCRQLVLLIYHIEPFRIIEDKRITVDAHIDQVKTVPNKVNI